MSGVGRGGARLAARTQILPDSAPAGFTPRRRPRGRKVESFPIRCLPGPRGRARATWQTRGPWPSCASPASDNIAGRRSTRTATITDRGTPPRPPPPEALPDPNEPVPQPEPPRAFGGTIPQAGGADPAPANGRRPGSRSPPQVASFLRHRMVRALEPGSGSSARPRRAPGAAVGRVTRARRFAFSALRKACAKIGRAHV